MCAVCPCNIFCSYPPPSEVQIYTLDNKELHQRNQVERPTAVENISFQDSETKHNTKTKTTIRR